MDADLIQKCPLELIRILVMNESEAISFHGCAVHGDRTASMESMDVELVEGMQRIALETTEKLTNLCGVVITLGEHGLVARFRCATGGGDSGGDHEVGTSSLNRDANASSLNRDANASSLSRDADASSSNRDFVTNSYNEWQDFRIHAFPTNAIDTTGAGDCFIGYFLATLCSHGADEWTASLVDLALKRASLASSISCSRSGAMSSIPKLDEVLQQEEHLLDKARAVLK